MLQRTNIGWADYSGGDLNFVIGCTPVSEGCTNCYARAWAKRAGRDFSQINVSWQKLNRLWKAKWKPGKEYYRRGPLSRPIMFPCGLSDLFHPDVPEDMILTALDIFAARDGGVVMDDLREDYEVFLIECPHGRLLARDSAVWCSQCVNWVEGREVGQVSIRVAPDGAIEAWGSGYIGEEAL